MFGSGELGMGVTFTFRDNATGPAGNAGRALQGLEGVVASAANSISSAASKITSGIVATVTAVTLLMAPFVSSVEASTEFNFQISRAGAIARASAVEIQQLKKVAFELGSTTMYNATEIAKTEVVLSQAGFAVAQQLELLPGITNLAEAGVVSLDYAAGLASDTLFQFGLRTKDMERVGDVIVNAANMSNMSVENFGAAMKYLGPTAKLFGIELEEAAGYIEMMANSGMRGSIGTRAFGTSLVNLSHPTKQAAEIMDQIGFNAYDTSGKFIGLTEMTRRLQKSLQGLTNQDRDKALSTIFGNEAIQEMVQLLSLEYTAIENGTEVTYKGADALEYFTQKNLEAKGVAAEVSRGMMDNLKSDLKLMTAAFDTLQIKMGDIQEGPIRIIVMKIRSLIQAITGLIETKFGQWLVGLAAVAATVASGMIVMGFAITILGPAIWSMITATAALTVALLPYIAILAAVATGFYLVYKAVDEFGAVMRGERGDAEGFMGILQQIGGVLWSVYEIWTSWNGQTFTLSAELHDALQRIGLLDFVLNLSTWIVRIKEFFNGFVEAAVYAYVIIETAFKQLGNSFSSLMDSIEQMGIPIRKLTGDLSIFKMIGYAVGLVVSTIAAPFVILASAINFVTNAIEFLIVNFKELIKIMPGGGALVAFALSGGDKSWLEPSNFKNTFNGGQGQMTPTSSKTSFSATDLGMRQAEIMASMGMKSSFGDAPTNGNMGPPTLQQVVVPVYLDTEKIGETILDLEKLKVSRK
jgi:TP901 family phage tail tape measure protein